ncbi:MAG: LuxR C-terminal-related transcriptional regulator, partial [Acetobacteraceae bacterium]|nr:LuxR C-terminal-related transcriptional regulator [Acetobacteraceae bacterium]
HRRRPRARPCHGAAAAAGARRAAPRGLLRELFGLTRSEAEVAQALASGASKVAVADARGLKETTVRTQVRAILDKAGAANLRELERLLAGLEGM